MDKGPLAIQLAGKSWDLGKRVTSVLAWRGQCEGYEKEWELQAWHDFVGILG